MKRYIIDRLEALEAVTEAREAERRRKSPFVEIRVESLSLDRVELVIYPCGLYGGSEKYPVMTLEDATETALRLADRDRVELSFWPWCREWVHAMYQTNPDLTDEQKERLRLEDLEKWPELSTLYDDGGKLLQLIGGLPQRMVLK